MSNRKIYLSTVNQNIDISDLGIKFNHPTVNYNLLDRITELEFIKSKSLKDLQETNKITLKDENNLNIIQSEYYLTKAELDNSIINSENINNLIKDNAVAYAVALGGIL